MGLKSIGPESMTNFPGGPLRGSTRAWRFIETGASPGNFLDLLCDVGYVGHVPGAPLLQKLPVGGGDDRVREVNKQECKADQQGREVDRVIVERDPIEWGSPAAKSKDGVRYRRKVMKNNKRAIKFYKKVGFDIEGRLKEFVFRDGKWIDVIIMGFVNKHEG